MTEQAIIPSLPGESSRWYSRLLEYVRIAPQSRSFLAVYNRERGEDGKGAARTIPGAWRQAVEAFRWRERAAKYDQETIERVQTDFQRDVERERKKRFELLKRARRKLAVALKALNPAGMSWKEFSAVFRAVFDEALAFDPLPGGATTGTLTPEDFVRRCQDAAGRMLTFDPGGEGK